MIGLAGVSVHRDGRLVLDGIELALDERRIGVIGANGSGKSTFARLLNGLLLPSRGSVTVDGLSTRDDRRRVQARVGFVFQNPDNQIVMPTVIEDVAFGLRNRGLDKAEIAAKAEAALARFGIDHLAPRAAHQLSAGEKQLLAVAGVVAMAPDVIVFDEPTTLLDLANTRRVMDTIAGLSETVILVTHDLDTLDGFERVLCFKDGRVFADGPPADTVAAYKADVA